MLCTHAGNHFQGKPGSAIATLGGNSFGRRIGPNPGTLPAERQARLRSKSRLLRRIVADALHGSKQDDSTRNHLAAGRLPLATLFLAIAAVAFGMAEFGAKAAESRRRRSLPPQAQTLGGPDTLSLATIASLPAIALLSSCTTSPQLSGEFIVDGGGGILLPLTGSVSLKRAHARRGAKAYRGSICRRRVGATRP